jgi:GTP cyclohydrolase I/GTP cyclohydrolase-4
VQNALPTLQVSLSRVGVTGVEKVVRIRDDDGREDLFSARLDCFVDLGPAPEGRAHVAFEETVNEAIGEAVLGEPAFRAEGLRPASPRPCASARTAARRGHGRRPLPRAQAGAGERHPHAGDLHDARLRGGVRDRDPRLVGVAAQGITACPCAQQLVAARRASG